MKGASWVLSHTVLHGVQVACHLRTSAGTCHETYMALRDVPNESAGASDAARSTLISSGVDWIAARAERR